LFIDHMQHPVVEVGILHVLQSGLSLESTPLSANGGILGKDARVQPEAKTIAPLSQSNMFCPRERAPINLVSNLAPVRDCLCHLTFLTLALN